MKLNIDMNEKHMTETYIFGINTMNQGPENKINNASTSNTYIVGQKLDAVWEAGVIGQELEGERVAIESRPAVIKNNVFITGGEVTIKNKPISLKN